MSAKDVPVGHSFTVPGSDTLYTVTSQWPGREWVAHLTEASFFDPQLSAIHSCTFAGHTEVVHCPPTSTASSS